MCIRGVNTHFILSEHSKKNIFNIKKAVWVSMNNRNVYDIEVSDYKGLTYKLEAFRSKVILVVNTATECIYSEQLKKLETLFQKYKDRGFVVLSFPNNNFDNRQPSC